MSRRLKHLRSVLAVPLEEKCMVSYSLANYVLGADITTAVLSFARSNINIVAGKKNAAIASFLQSSFKYLLFLNGNVILPAVDLADLVSHDLDVVGTARVQTQRRGFHEIDAVLSHFMLIARRVLKKVGPLPFLADTDGDGVVTADEDAVFCRTVRAAGFSIYTSADLDCASLNRYDLPRSTERIVFNPGGRLGVMVAMLHIGKIELTTLITLLQLTAAMRWKHRLEVGFYSDSPTYSNRNRIVRDFLGSSCDYLLMLDDDVGLSPKVILNALRQDFDIFTMFCGGWINVGPAQKHALFTRPVLPFVRRNGYVKIEFGGGAVMLIARRVLEHEGMASPFQDVYTNDGTRTTGEDVYFYRRAQRLGFEAWALPRYHLHIDKLNMNDLELLARLTPDNCYTLTLDGGVLSPDTRQSNEEGIYKLT